MSERATAIGIDIGGTNLRAGRVSSGGEILDWSAESITRDPVRVLDRTIALCRELDEPGIAGIGIGVPGRVDAKRRTVLSGGYLDLTGSAFAERIEDATGKPVVIDNDCNMALVAEMATGAAQGFDNVVMMTIGTGIGGAVVLDGKIVRGRTTAGQLGHLTVVHDGLRCACGRRGCIETTSSGTALGRLIAEASYPAGTTAESLLDQVEAGDGRANALIDRWIRPLRDAIDTLAAVLDPDLVLLGGGLGAAATRALARAPSASAWFNPAVAAAQLGDDAGVIGSAVSALIEHLMDGGATSHHDNEAARGA